MKKQVTGDCLRENDPSGFPLFLFRYIFGDFGNYYL